MSIRRCPYCKAIIEEGAEFCSNCGTQLLFPEDEKIEEDIPGEKIVDDDSDDDEEEEETVPLEEEIDEDPVAEDILDSVEEEEPPLLNKEEKEEEPDEVKTDESVDFSDIEAIQKPEEDGEEKKDVPDDIHLEEQEISSEEQEEKIELEEEWSEKRIHEEESVEISLDNIDEEVSIKEIEKETHSDSKDEDLRMEDLENTGDSFEKEKQEIDRFIDSIKQAQGEDIVSAPISKEPVVDFIHEEPVKAEVPDFMPHPEESQIIEEPIQEEPVHEEPVIEEPVYEEPVVEDPIVEEPIEEDPVEEKIVEDSRPLSSTPPLFEKQIIVPPSDELPAWASKINDESPSNIPMTEEEKEFEPQEKIPTLDTGMGLPEVAAQKDLPFSGESKKAKEVQPKESPSQFSAWIKPRIFDVLFIGAVWFITTWIASYVMEVKLFKLISAAALLLTVFYVVLLSAYLFLFFFFLGETLGDYLFGLNRGSGFSRLD
ncbi:zinc ribbon domain-containing protein [Acidobacteriota bacterium]